MSEELKRLKNLILEEEINSIAQLKKRIAILEEESNNKEKVIDALYPIMGNMISRYVGESFKDFMYDLNEKMKLMVFIKAFIRKIKAKFLGISEIELLLKDSLIVRIDTIFLIHKESGLLMIDLYRDHTTKIKEPEMVASMLSAIRSFVNEWVAENTKMGEVNTIEYGNSSIYIESAGSCYLAVVMRGTPEFMVKNKISKVLEYIIEIFGYQIGKFDGDITKLDIKEISTTLLTLFDIKENHKKTKGKIPFLSKLVLFILFLIPTFWFIQEYRENLVIEKKRDIFIDNLKDVKIYDMEISKLKNNKISVNGFVMSDNDLENLNFKLQNSRLKIKNRVTSIESSLVTTQIQKEVDKSIKIFNKIEGSDIEYKFDNSLKYISIKGIVADKKRKNSLISIIKNIYGLENFNFQIETLPIFEKQIYFDNNEFKIKDKYKILLDKYAKIMLQYTQYYVRITGYTNEIGSTLVNKKLSLNRAEMVKEELVKRGINRDKFILDSVASEPKEILILSTKKQKELSRCVIFSWELIKK